MKWIGMGVRMRVLCMYAPSYVLGRSSSAKSELPPDCQCSPMRSSPLRLSCSSRPYTTPRSRADTMYKGERKWGVRTDINNKSSEAELEHSTVLRPRMMPVGSPHFPRKTPGWEDRKPKKKRRKAKKKRRRQRHPSPSRCQRTVLSARMCKRPRPPWAQS